MTLLLLLSALADEGPAAASAQERLDTAWRRIDLGDFEGARILADEVRELEPAWEQELTYLEGVSFQLERDHDSALVVFDRLVDTWPDGGRVLDTNFRRALTMADAGRHDDAMDALRRLKPYGKLPDEARAKIGFCEATWLFETGKTGPGLRKITKALRKTAPDALTWFQARARHAVLTHAVEASMVLDFAGVPERKLKSVLEDRAVYVLSAEAELNALVDLGETWFILEGLREVGDAYADLARDFRDAPTPDGLGLVEAAKYRIGMDERAAIQLVKARKYFDLGVEHATRIGWLGDEGEVLRARLDAVDAEIEALEAEE
jgi:tetratricopeptide (TPR) repeat protein